MKFNATDVRSEADSRLGQRLLQDPHVQKINEGLARRGSSGTRRSLLAQALRLNRAIAPDLCDVVEACRERLGAETEVELFVYAEPRFNAGCTQPEKGRVFVLVTSSLLEAFSPDELTFVIGHELGHHVYGHHGIPLPVILANHQRLPKELVLTAHSWQRHAEISADRAGMLCCGGLDPAARSLFKLASGMREAPSEERVAAFVEQAVELYRESDSAAPEDRGASADWLSTHPFSPIRLRAAQAFARSAAFVESGPTVRDTEIEVHDLMRLMEPGYLKEDSPAAEAMRRLLFAAGAALGSADGVLTRDERQVLEEMLGALPQRVDPEVLASLIPERIKAVRDAVRPSRRAQLIRDLALVARADGVVHPKEIELMEGLAADLDVEVRLVRAALEGPIEVD